MLGMERGLPTVTTPHGTTGYRIDAQTHESGSQGVLVAPHTDPHAFSKAVTRLLQNSTLWHVASKGALEHVRTHFSGNRLQDDLEQLLSAAAAYRKQQ